MGETHDYKPQLTLESAAVTHTAREQLLWERELLGLYLSQHPLEAFATILSEQTVPLSALTAEHDNRVVNVGGRGVTRERKTDRAASRRSRSTRSAH